MRTILFDTKVLNYVSNARNAGSYRQLFAAIETQLLSEAGEEYQCFVTPVLLLEYLGIAFKSSDFPQIAFPEEIANSNAAKTISEYVQNQARESFLVHPKLSAAHIRDRYANMFANINTAATPLWRDLIGRIVLSDELLDPIIVAMARDFKYGFDYRNQFNADMVQRIHVNFILDLIQNAADSDNSSIARGLFEVCEELKRRESGSSFAADIWDAFKAKIGLKLYKDRGDLDIVHLVCAGGYFNGEKVPITVISSDPQAPLFKRIRTYRSMLLHLKSNLERSTNEILVRLGATITTVPGSIAHFDEATGTFTSITSVDALPIIR